MSKIDIEENRFHALKFAAQTLGAAHPAEVVQAASLYLDFLEGRANHRADPVGTPGMVIEDTELSDLTESYPADEPEPPVAVVDSWAAADHAISDIALA